MKRSEIKTLIEINKSTNSDKRYSKIIRKLKRLYRKDTDYVVIRDFTVISLKILSELDYKTEKVNDVAKKMLKILEETIFETEE